jgi:hypothetical protein
VRDGRFAFYTNRWWRRASLVILYPGGLSRSLKGAIVEIAIAIAAALVIVAIGYPKPSNAKSCA